MNPPAVFLGDEQSDHPVDTAKWLELANNVLIAQRVGSDFEVNIVYVDEQSIAELNERFMDKKGPTDVLSFPIDESEPVAGRMPDNSSSGPANNADDVEATQMLGDIVICPAVAFKNAPDHAGNYEDELALLLVHGVLHLMGMDHHEDEEAEEMEARERELLEEFYKPLRPETWQTIHLD